ncbi:uncharacterized protein THITE_2037256 [Thermothielavioides terrestris NRRL 8126]|uniref:DNA-binding protein RAP1 n=1 Tax=Thermothielavioides terrestris (strain ATCC 38088 / NRRL 8126) TaxID=578455 RepID=G2QX03_THETT|nr:uncharacterized protein THITE_2037256 [Thermothielavioides terrestris NRRL 8126]AEO63969.1 hypothetical protein THITE_2037256 [Thermothielavioides terrestris NRRL 8126]
MAAPTVYEGVHGKCVGSLFNGIKFWVSMRVPLRSMLTSRKDNGGNIVLLEKHADVLIADHARKDTPAGSVSWKYVEDSVAKGELLNIEDYQICHTAPRTRSCPLASAHPSQYPQHSWQSWRTKWVKNMALLREELLPKPLPDLFPPGGPPANGPPTAAQESKSRAAARAPTAQFAEIHPQLASGARASPRESEDLSDAPTERVRFTAEDDEILMQYVRKCVQAGLKPKGNNIYIDLENKRPLKSAAESSESEKEPGRSPHTSAPAKPSEPESQRQDSPLRADATSANGRPTARESTPPVLTMNEFWTSLHQFNEVAGSEPKPWVQIGQRCVDLWDLWRFATEEPHHASRDWEAISEKLGFDWIVQPEVPVHVRTAFEKHLLEFENVLREFEGFRKGESGDSQGDEEEEGEGEEKEDEGEDDEEEEEEDAVNHVNGRDTAPQPSDIAFASSPPILGLKRGRGSSAAFWHSPISKRPRRDPSSEIPCTPEGRHQQDGQAAAAAAVWESPARAPRVVQGGERPNNDEEEELEEEEEEDEEVEEVLTPSRQLQLEVEAASPDLGSAGNIAITSSRTSQPLSFAQRDDSDAIDSNSSSSSDGFEAISELPRRTSGNMRAAPHHDNPSRRTLPASWSTGNMRAAPHHDKPSRRTLPSSWSTVKGKQPANSRTPSATPAPAPCPPSSTTAKGKQPASAPTPSTTTARTPAPTPSNRELVIQRYLSQQADFAPALDREAYRLLVQQAVAAATCENRSTSVALRSLVAGGPIPADAPGVWTAEDDRQLRYIGPHVDGLRGSLVFGREDRAPFGGDERAWALFWQLAKKHGADRVLRRREWLKAWDAVAPSGEAEGV